MSLIKISTYVYVSKPTNVFTPLVLYLKGYLTVVIQGAFQSLSNHTRLFQEQKNFQRSSRYMQIRFSQKVSLIFMECFPLLVWSWNSFWFLLCLICHNPLISRLTFYKFWFCWSQYSLVNKLFDCLVVKLIYVWILRRLIWRSMTSFSEKSTQTAGLQKTE